MVENPFLKFVDYYQHYFVNTPRANELYTQGIVKGWLNKRIDKLSKDKNHAEGERYFEISDLEEGILTFRQFINFIVKAPEETTMGKVDFMLSYYFLKIYHIMLSYKITHIYLSS